MLWEFTQTQMPVVLHIIVGFLLLFGTLALLIRAIRFKERIWVISSAISLVAVLTAVVTGSFFITLQADVYSFIMALAFIVALLSYGWGLYKSER